MINKYCFCIICILIIVTGSQSQNICFKSCVGIDKLTAFPATTWIGGKEYSTIEKFSKTMCYSFAFYVTKFRIIDVGIRYSSFSAPLNKHTFPDSFRLSGQAKVLKIGPSLLLGKIENAKHHTYFIVEPGYYYTEDNTSIERAGLSGGGCYYVGNSIFGIGLGMGFDYSFQKHIGLSSSATYDLAKPFDANFSLSYLSIQIGILLSY